MVRIYRRDEAQIKKIQIFGERCSGTNYLTSLLKKNLPETRLIWAHGWKHWFYRGGATGEQHTLFLIIYRHPIAWLQSFHNNPWHTAPSLRNISFSEFIRQEWHCVWNEEAAIGRDDPKYHEEMMFERNPDNGERFPNVLALRRSKIINFEALKERFSQVCYMNYEQLSDNPENELRVIAENFHLAIRKEFVNEKNDKGTKEKPFSPRRYPNISMDDYEHIFEHLDTNREKTIGY